MKKHIILPILVILLASLMLAACASSPEATVSTPVSSTASSTVSPDDEQPVLELQGLKETKTLTMADLKAMPATEGWGGTVSSAGVISPPEQLKGVTLLSLTDLVGGLQPGEGVNIVAKDGYGMTMSYDQISQGDFITYDPGTGDENQVEGPLQVIVAYERGGEPISPDEDGPLRLFIVSPKNDNVVDGHWTVKWVNQIRVKPMSEEWSLNLEGSHSEIMDRNSFESCSAPGCHQASWTDEDGNVWSGVPLYYLAGRVDGGNVHGDRAYNDIFAKAGYVLELFAADGYNVSIPSDQTIFNRDLLLASTVNGEPLDEKNFPLRLVGKGLEKGDMVGQVAQIVINPNEGVEMPPDETATPETPETTAEPEEMVLPEGAALMIYGEVLNKLTLTLDNLESMNPVEIEAEHPKKGLQTYRGIRLNDLLSLAGPEAEANTLVMTSSDGYTTEVSLSDVRNCPDCLIAIEDDGTLSMVMVGMESNFWAKMVNFLEVK
jgi:DMSO/TMAO reductase YedYZ molybdopterin-dependent catalytic subunit